MRTQHTAGHGLASLVCLVALGASSALPALAARKAACPEGRFAVTEGGDMLGEATILALHAGTLMVEGSCPAAGTVGKTGRKGTRLAARWDRCGTLERVRLRATAARDCSAVRGKVRARRAGRKALLALPSTCGDGVLDPGADEQCDGAQGCAEDETCAATCECERAPEPMDCVVEGFPCSWSEVAPGIVEQSVALADEASAILMGGGTVAEAEQVLQAGNAAVVEVDGRTIRFRLPGGRPVWVEGDGIGNAPAAPAQAMRTTPSGAGGFATRDTRVTHRAVVSPGRFPKAALTLAPVAWLPGAGDDAPLVAGLISGIEDYAGNVISLANATEASTVVDVPTFASLDGYNVVYVRTHGARLCRVPGPTGQRCFVTIKAAGLPRNAPWQRFDETRPGVDLVTSDGNWYVAVSADFFRHYYPHGLNDVLVVLDAGKTAESDLARSMTGRRSSVVGWSDAISGEGTDAVVMPFLTGLAAGRSTGDVYLSMGQDVRDPGTGADLVIGQQDIRIRDLVRVYDPDSLQALVTNGLLGIDGYTDDDVPDHLLLPMDFWGASEEDAAGYTVRVWVDGVALAAEPLDMFATPSGDRQWHAEADLDLGYDVHEKQPLEITVSLELPEGGASVYKATPLATGEGFSPGKKWTGHFTKTSSNGLFQIDIAVDATFVRDPAEDLTSKHPTFLLTSGTMTWMITDLGGDNCVHTAPMTVTNLVPNDGAYLKFDLTDQPQEYMGFARTEGPQVELVRSCPGSDPVTSHTQAGGVWFQALGEEHYVASGSPLVGYYDNGAPLASIHEWSIEKVE